MQRLDGIEYLAHVVRRNPGRQRRTESKTEFRFRDSHDVVVERERRAAVEHATGQEWTSERAIDSYVFLTGKARCGNLPADDFLARQLHDGGLGRITLRAIGRPTIRRQLVNP